MATRIVQEQGQPHDPATRRYTIDEFYDVANDPAYAGLKVELHQGEIVTMPPGSVLHMYVIDMVTEVLRKYMHEHGGYAGSEAPFAVVRHPDGADTVRAYDAIYLAPSRLPQSFYGRAFTQGPTLAVEVLSPGNSHGEMLSKRLEMQEIGTQWIWFIDPQQRLAQVWAAPLYREIILKEDDFFDGGEIMPDLRVYLKDLLPPRDKPNP